MRYFSKLDRLAKWITIITILIVVCFGTWIYIRSASTFLPAWITILFWAIFALVMMSVPKYIEITPDGIEIDCTVEITFIAHNDISRIKIIAPTDMRWCFPVAGIFGYFGYYGYYFNFRERKLFKLYARNRRGYVLIETIYEKRYILGVDMPEEFIKQLETKKPL